MTVRRLRRQRPPEHLAHATGPRSSPATRPGSTRIQGTWPGPQPALPEPRRLPLQGRDRDQRHRRLPRRQLHGDLRRLHRRRPARHLPGRTTIGPTGSTGTWATASSTTTRSPPASTRTGNSMGVATTVGPDGDARPVHHQHHRPGRVLRHQPGQHVHDEQRRTRAASTSPTTRPSRGIVDTAWGWGTAFVDMDGDGAPGPLRRAGHARVRRQRHRPPLQREVVPVHERRHRPELHAASRAPAATSRATSGRSSSSTTTATARPTC